ncbi:MAG: RDD family protein [Bacteroidia bacterium]
METNISITYPTLVKRFQSLFVDQVFIIICMAVFSMLLGNPEDESLNGIRGLLLFGLFFVYEPLCMVFGCTAGNFIAGIRVRRFSDPAQKINLFQSYLRFIVKLLLGIISFFTVTSDKHKRALHDKVSGSVMIYKPKA